VLPTEIVPTEHPTESQLAEKKKMAVEFFLESAAYSPPVN
jgi:hypothetical protein